jgi:hypothetical protein
MSALDNLRSMARGERPADDGLLGNTRCTWGGIDLLSEEAIVAAFVASPFALDGELIEVETTQGAALVGTDRALYADLYDGRIGRLWRIGGTPPFAPEPAVDVAFDPDMRQERGGLCFRGEDHPCLDTSAVDGLVAAGQSLIDGQRAGQLRVRGFVVRASGNGGASAALVALHTLSNTPSRVAGFRFAALALRNGKVISAVEPERVKSWTPRL